MPARAVDYGCGGTELGALDGGSNDAACDIVASSLLSTILCQGDAEQGDSPRDIDLDVRPVSPRSGTPSDRSAAVFDVAIDRDYPVSEC